MRWRESVLWMAAQGVTHVAEIGAGKALSGMARRIDKAVATSAAGTADEVRKLAAEILEGGKHDV